MDHSELIAEFSTTEQLPVARRLELARSRRVQQLAKYREWTEHEPAPSCSKKRISAVRFPSNIVLLEAAARGDAQEVAHLLESGCDANARNEDGLTPLHQCCIDNCEEVLLLLLKFGADVSARDTELWTPLHAGACCGNLAICKHLISHGADLLAVNADGNMPYDICDDEVTLDFLESEMAMRGITQEQIDSLRGNGERHMLNEMQLFHTAGGNLEFKDAFGAAPVAQFLLDCGVSVDVRDNDGWEPIHAAACWAQPVILEMLVLYGADVYSKTDTGETSADLCEEPEVRDIIYDICRRQNAQLNLNSDSRRSSKRKKPSSKFESPQFPMATPSSENHSSSRAIKRLSLRDKSGATLARLEARQEALLRCRSFDDASASLPTEHIGDISPIVGEKLEQTMDDWSVDAPAQFPLQSFERSYSLQSKEFRSDRSSSQQPTCVTITADQWIKKLGDEEAVGIAPSEVHCSLVNSEARSKLHSKPNDVQNYNDESTGAVVCDKSYISYAEVSDDFLGPTGHASATIRDEVSSSRPTMHTVAPSSTTNGGCNKNVFDKDQTLCASNQVARSARNTGSRSQIQASSTHRDEVQDLQTTDVRFKPAEGQHSKSLNAVYTANNTRNTADIDPSHSVPLHLHSRLELSGNERAVDVGGIENNSSFYQNNGSLGSPVAKFKAPKGTVLGDDASGHMSSKIRVGKCCVLL